MYLPRRLEGGLQRLHTGLTRPPPFELLELFPGERLLKYFVTGGAGFIGAHLVNRLLDTTQASVTVFDNFFTGFEQAPPLNPSANTDLSSHGTPLATGDSHDRCGVPGAFLLEVGISSSYHIAKFWGLTGHPRRAVAKRSKPARTSPRRPRRDPGATATVRSDAGAAEAAGGVRETRIL